MNLQILLGKYNNYPCLKQLADRILLPQSEKIFLKNLQGSSAEFVAASIFQRDELKNLDHVFVLNDAEEAAYFHNTLENLTSALNLFYFPSSFKNYYIGCYWRYFI